MIKYQNTAFLTSKYSADLGKFLVLCTNSLIYGGEELPSFVNGKMSYSFLPAAKKHQGDESSAVKYFEVFWGHTHIIKDDITLSGSTHNQSCRIL